MFDPFCQRGLKPPSNFIAGSPKAALLFWFFMVVLLSICLWYVSIVATCTAAHLALCHASLYNNKNQKISENRCLVFFLIILYCDTFVVIVLSIEPRQN